MSRKIFDKIKNTANSDYRIHSNGIVCDIYEAYQLNGMCAALSVAPVDFNLPQNITQNPRRYNVVPIGSAGIFGFPTALKESHYAYVLTDDAAKIEGKPAVIIPKNVLTSNPGADWGDSPNIINPSGVMEMTVRKDNNIVSRKYS